MNQTEDTRHTPAGVHNGPGTMTRIHMDARGTAQNRDTKQGAHFLS